MDAINAGRQAISYFPENRVAKAVASGHFGATSEACRLAEADIILICVPTPLSATRDPDMSYVVRAAETIVAHLRPGRFGGAGKHRLAGRHHLGRQADPERAGLRAGTDFFLGFSPEREDPGNHQYGTRDIPKIVGADRYLRPAGAILFLHRDRGGAGRASATAEAVKLVENSFRTVNIALVNEMKDALDAMGVDVWEVVRAAATKPFGYMPFIPVSASAATAFPSRRSICPGGPAMWGRKRR